MSAAPDDLADLLRRLRNLTGATRETLCQAADAIEALQRQLSEARAALAASCEDERSQLYEAARQGGCMRALVAERQLSDSRAEGEKMRAALEAVANECDPDDPEWHFPAEGRRACWDIVRAALSHHPVAEERES